MSRALLVDPSARGGIATYTRRLTEALAEVGQPVDLLASRGLAEPPTLPGVTVRRALPDHPWGRPEAVTPAFYLRRAGHAVAITAALARAVREVRPDVVHLQHSLHTRLDAAYVRALRRRAAVVLTAHDVVPFEGDPQSGLPALREADAVLVHTVPAQQALGAQGVQADLVAHVPAGVPAGVDAGADRAALRAELGLPVEGRLLAALGFVRPYKGYDLLAEVWESLGPEAPWLVVVGQPWSAEDERVLDRLEATGRAVVRRGYADDATLARTARAADAVLLPHVTASDSGLLHLAGALGTPVLASDAPQLAASVRATGGGVSLPRSAPLWGAAVTGDLPPAPPPPAPLAATGRAHVALWEQARARRSAPRLLVCSDAQAWGGAEAVAAQVLDGLADGWHRTALGVSDDVVRRLAGQRHPAAARVVPPVAGKRDLPGVVATVRAVRAARPDVVLLNLQVPWAGQYALLATCLLPRVPVVAVEHCPVPTTSAVQRAVKRLGERRLSAHVAVSGAAARRTEQVCGLPAGSVGVLRNGLPRPGEVAPAPFPDDLDRPLLVAVGRLDPVKGFDVLLEALALLPDAALWLLGEGEQRPALEAQAVRLGLTDRVRMTGWHDAPLRALAAADVAVVPSRYESSPFVVAEALLAGVPLVASDVGGIPELAGSGAVLVAPEDPRALADALRPLLADSGARAALAAAGRAAAADLPTTASAVAAYDTLLRGLLPAGTVRSRSTQQAS